MVLPWPYASASSATCGCVLWRRVPEGMQNEACTVLFKYTHVGSRCQDEWLVLCPDSRVVFARKTKAGHRAFGSVGSWHPTSSGFDLVACLGADPAPKTEAIPPTALVFYFHGQFIFWWPMDDFHDFTPNGFHDFHGFHVFTVFTFGWDGWVGWVGCVFFSAAKSYDWICYETQKWQACL